MTDPTWQQPPANQPGPTYPTGQQYPPFPSRNTDARPATVLAASVLTWVFSCLALMGAVLLAVTGSVARDQLVKELEKDESFSDLGIAADSLADGLILGSIVVAVLSVIAILVAVIAFRRSTMGRILLVVMSGVTVILALLASVAIFPFLWVIAGVSVIVLLFTGGANEWYGRKNA